MNFDDVSLDEIVPVGHSMPVGDTPYADDRPLFIIGAPRSGTTFLRDTLRRAPNFVCPEETHFYRWAEPFRTPASFGFHRQNKLLIEHRRIDGVPDEVFQKIMTRSRSKQELMRRYITVFAAAKGIKGPYRWFEKTPQNVYGMPLMLQDFPNGRFIHLVRNPLNVVASLILGRQMKVPDIHGACNYWLEAVQFMMTMKRAYPKLIKRVHYEDLTTNVPEVVGDILEFADIEMPKGIYSVKDAYVERNQWKDVFSKAQRNTIVNRCGGVAKKFGYDLKATISEVDPV